MQKLLQAAACAILLLAGCAAPGTGNDARRLYGDPAPPGIGRLIVIDPETRYVNVQGGEFIRFQAGGQEFGWRFNVARTVSAFDLNEVAPPGFLLRRVRAYVSPDPRYLHR